MPKRSRFQIELAVTKFPIKETRVSHTMNKALHPVPPKSSCTRPLHSGYQTARSSLLAHLALYVGFLDPGHAYSDGNARREPLLYGGGQKKHSTAVILHNSLARAWPSWVGGRNRELGRVGPDPKTGAFSDYRSRCCRPARSARSASMALRMKLADLPVATLQASPPSERSSMIRSRDRVSPAIT